MGESGCSRRCMYVCTVDIGMSESESGLDMNVVSGRCVYARTVDLVVSESECDRNGCDAGALPRLYVCTVDLGESVSESGLNRKGCDAGALPRLCTPT